MNNVKASVSNEIVNELGQKFPSIRKLAEALHISKKRISNKLRAGEPFVYGGHPYTLSGVNYIGFENVNENTETNEQTPVEYSQDYKDFLNAKKVSELPFEKYEFNVSVKNGKRKYAVALFSDAHIEETVNPNSVLGLNEYNIEIAENRICCYFKNLAKALNADEVENLIFASLGDTISSFIWDELVQMNSLTPIEATLKAQSLLFSGLEYLVKNTSVKHIKFIGIVGNHSRTTKKIQHSNGYKMSYEWLMYKNIENQSKLLNLPIEFCIPESEMAIVEIPNGKKFIFIHGFQIKGGSGISGVLPSLNKMALKWERIFHQDKVYLGHFHNFMSLTNIGVNGSIIGYNTYALTNAMFYEKPLQLYDLYDENDLILTRKIYCE